VVVPALFLGFLPQAFRKAKHLRDVSCGKPVNFLYQLGAFRHGFPPTMALG